MVETVTVLLSRELREVMDADEPQRSEACRAVAEVFAMQAQLMQACLLGFGRVGDTTPEELVQVFRRASRMTLTIEAGLRLGVIEFRFEFFQAARPMNPLLTIKGDLNWCERDRPATLMIAAAA